MKAKNTFFRGAGRARLWGAARNRSCRQLGAYRCTEWQQVGGTDTVRRRTNQELVGALICAGMPVDALAAEDASMNLTPVRPPNRA